MEKQRQKQVARVLLKEFGTTYAREAGIRLEDKPAALFQLLVAATLSSARISADNAMRATKALFDAGWTTPDKMGSATWAERVKVLNTNGYARYDEKTSRMLGNTAEHLEERYQGDLRKLREEAGQDVGHELELLQEFKGIGEAGAKIFLREAQAVWEEAYPFVDERASRSSSNLGLPKTAKSLAGLVDGPEEMARLVAALVRVELAGKEARERVLDAA